MRRDETVTLGADTKDIALLHCHLEVAVEQREYIKEIAQLDSWMLSMGMAYHHPPSEPRGLLRWGFNLPITLYRAHLG